MPQTLFTFGAAIELPPDGGRGGPVIWYKQNGDWEQYIEVDTPQPIRFGNGNAAWHLGFPNGDHLAQGFPSSPNIFRWHLACAYKEAHLDPGKPWMSSPLKYFGERGLWGDPNHPDARPATLVFGTEDNIWQKQNDGYTPDQWKYTVLEILLCYFPMPLPTGGTQNAKVTMDDPKAQFQWP